MAEAVQVSVTAAGWAERARAARAFTAGLTGPGHPCGDDAALPGSELSGSRLRHSRPGVPGDTVTVGAGEGIVRVEVTGRSRRVPELGPADRDAEGSRGLQDVAGDAARWGWWRRGGRTVTWSGLSYGWYLRLTAVPA